MKSSSVSYRQHSGMLDKDLAAVQGFDKGLIDVLLFLHLPTFPSSIYTLPSEKEMAYTLEFFNQSYLSSASLNHSIHRCENDLSVSIC